MMFWILSAAGLLLAAATGTLYTADVVSREKREGTLALLFLTHLNVWDVVVGKLASRAIGGLFVLLAIQPILLISAVQSSVMPIEYARMVLLQGVTAAASLSIGLLSSTFGTHPRTSPLLSAAVVSCMGGIFPLSGWLLQTLGNTASLPFPNIRAYTEVLGLMTPIKAFLYCSAADFQMQPQRYWFPILYTAAAGGAAAVIAGLRLGRIWKDSSIKTSQAKRRITARAIARRQRILDYNPIVWLVERHRLRLLIPWVLGIACAVVALLEFRQPASRFSNIFALTAFTYTWGGRLGLVVFLFQVWVASEAGRQLHEDRRNGAIEMQVTTPLPDWKIINGHREALWRAARWPAALVVSAAIVSLAAAPGIATSSGPGVSSISAALPSYLHYPLGALSIATFAVNCGAIALMSLEGALTLKSGQIAFNSLFKVLFIPQNLWYLAEFCLTSVWGGTPGTGPLWLTVLLSRGWMVVSIVSSIILGRNALKRLNLRFRKLAALPYESLSNQRAFFPISKPSPRPESAR